MDHSSIKFFQRRGSDNSFTAGTDRKLQFTHNLVESLWPTDVNVISELILMICYDLKLCY